MRATATIQLAHTNEALIALWGKPQLKDAVMDYVKWCIALMPEVTLYRNTNAPVAVINTKSQGRLAAQAESIQVLLPELSPTLIMDRLRIRQVKEVSMYTVMFGSDPRMDMYIRGFFIR